ncbi:MAG TPA: hypothetical protein VK777_11980 [Reyranella sp.]|jgi:hypothetical protein|nr:hypothetical protein [Reyranella sp.]
MLERARRWLIFTLLAPLLPLIAASGIAAPLDQKSGASPVVRDGRWLVLQLKAVVDGSELYTPENLARTLALDLQASEKKTPMGTGACTNPKGGGTWTIIKTTYRATTSWYKPTSEGIQDMKVPQVFINPATVAGEPAIDYAIYRSSVCDGIPGARWETGAVFSLNNLSSFACLTPGKLKAWIDTEFHEATDGVSVSSYSGAPNDQYGIYLEFVFRMGAPCALGATIRQDDRSGLRYRRAATKLYACIESAENELCATKPDATSAEFDEVTRTAKAACGNLETIYQSEPLTGRAPAPQPRICFDSSKPACQRKVACN